MTGTQQVVTKGEFAKICNVDASRVSQWLKEGKIGPDAVVGEGRSAKIIVGIAQRQIRARTDSGQAFGNGLGTRLNASQAPRNASPQGYDGPEDGGESIVGDALDEQIKRERLEALQRANRLASTEEAAKQGVYTETAAVRRQMNVVAAQALRVFEGAIPEISTKIAGRFKLEEREVSLFLADIYRDVRAEAAKKAQAAAAKLDTLVPDSAGE